jgi:hypothetical protein
MEGFLQEDILADLRTKKDLEIFEEIVAIWLLKLGVGSKNTYKFNNRIC